MTAVGSIDALRDVLSRRSAIVLPKRADVVIVPTASAFSGAEAAAVELAELFEASGAKVEALMNVSRDSSDEPHFAQRVRDADLVVLSDGSALHAKSVWRGTLVGEAIRECSPGRRDRLGCLGARRRHGRSAWGRSDDRARAT